VDATPQAQSKSYQSAVKGSKGKKTFLSGTRARPDPQLPLKRPSIRGDQRGDGGKGRREQI